LVRLGWVGGGAAAAVAASTHYVRGKIFEISFGETVFGEQDISISNIS